MDPAAGYSEIIFLLLQGMVDLVTVGHQYPGIILKKFTGMIRFSGTPVIIEDDGMLFRSSGAVDPHITLVTGTPAIADHFEGSFVRMDQVRSRWSSS